MSRRRSSGDAVFFFVSAVCVGIYLANGGSVPHIHLPDTLAAAGTHGSTHESARARKAIRYARAHLGDAYVWAGTGPDGFDCSGLTMMAWQSAGVTIPRTSEMQLARLHHVSRLDLEPGDLVFSYWPGVDGQPSPNHVQMYVGHGYVIGADSTDVERVPLSSDAGHIVGYANPTAR